MASTRIGFSVLAVTSATWRERTFPLRSTRETTASWLGSVFAYARFFCLAADKCFVRFNSLAFAAKLSAIGRAHCLTNAVRHEPSRFVCDAEHAVKLMRRHAF